MKLNQSETVLFLGDSITCANRDLSDFYALGEGFVKLVADDLSERDITVINRGVNGTRANDLLNRIYEDLMEIKPDVVSILIGVNDTVNNLRHKEFDLKTEKFRFESIYRNILQELRERGVKRIILCEPFLLQNEMFNTNWRLDLTIKIHSIRKLAQEFKTEYLSLEGTLYEQAIVQGFDALSDDGIHPSKEGHRHIAKRWLSKVEKGD